MSDCIPWKGRLNRGGYGMKGEHLAHRVAWEQQRGAIPDGMQIHHRCGVHNCVNVEHMDLMTAADHSIHHGSPAGFMALVDSRREQTHCIHGHEYTDENTGRDRKGKRYCKSCNRQRSRSYHARNRERILPVMRDRERKRRLEQKAAVSHHDRFGGFSGWGCGGA